jgi:DNA-binding GntR family transcriptional regulator
MTDNLPVQNPPLADQVYEIILKNILEGEYSPGSQLPSENQLAERYQVSRPTIRTAFSRLVELGYVVKKQGVGTFVTNSPNLVNPLYLSYNVMDRITSRGFDPGFKQISAQIIPANPEIAEKLRVPPDSPILNVHKLFTADGNPIIYFENSIPEWVYSSCLSEDEVLMPGTTEPFFQFFAERCKAEVKFLTSIIHPEILKECTLPDDFKVYSPQTTVLRVEDVGYSAENRQVFLSQEYLLGEASYFHVIRHVGNI